MWSRHAWAGGLSREVTGSGTLEVKSGRVRALVPIVIGSLLALTLSVSANVGSAVARASVSHARVARLYYTNPLRRIRQLHAKRIDEGVDYSGSGPVKALGAGTLTVIDRGTSHFWAHVDGNVVVERMSQGPLTGVSIYTAENCTPNRALRVGQHVAAATTICQLHNHFPYLETGVAENNASGIPAAWPVYRLFPDGSKTAYGLDFSHLLGALGAPRGNTQHGAGDVSYHPQTTVGKLPLGFPRF